jgi:predicted Zn-dependent protease
MPRLDQFAFDQAFALVVTSDTRAMPSRTTRLNTLLGNLRRDDFRGDPDETMELIWAIWINHKDTAAADCMAKALDAIEAGNHASAKPLLDRLVAEHPDWAEAWNKRALVAFIEERDDDSIKDIARTLALEPHHFGAILGFAQICLRHGCNREAKAAFAVAQRINRHINGIGAVIAELNAYPGQLH